MYHRQKVSYKTANNPLVSVNSHNNKSIHIMHSCNEPMVQNCQQKYIIDSRQWQVHAALDTQLQSAGCLKMFPHLDGTRATMKSLVLVVRYCLQSVSTLHLPACLVYLCAYNTSHHHSILPLNGKTTIFS